MAAIYEFKPKQMRGSKGAPEVCMGHTDHAAQALVEAVDHSFSKYIKKCLKSKPVVIKKVHKDKAGPMSGQKNKNIQDIHPDPAHLKT